jgi:hypothetical protein
VRKIVRDARADDYRWQSIIGGIVKSGPFLMRTAPIESAAAPAPKQAHVTPASDLK